MKKTKHGSFDPITKTKQVSSISECSDIIAKDNKEIFVHRDRFEEAVRRRANDDPRIVLSEEHYFHVISASGVEYIITVFVDKRPDIGVLVGSITNAVMTIVKP